MKRSEALMLATALVSASCSTAGPSSVVSAPGPAPGSTKQSAIEVCMPNGEREYLSRLRCEDGSAPLFERTGSFGSRNPLPEEKPGESTEQYEKRVFGSSSALMGAPLKAGDVDYHIVDGYRLSCKSVRSMLYLDMYHCAGRPPMVAPAGFSIVPSTSGAR